MSKYIGYIDVCYIEEPFIYSIKGDFTLQVLKTIEDELNRDDYAFNDKYIGKETVRFMVTLVEEETQYGTGYGDVYTLPSYYYLTCTYVK